MSDQRANATPNLVELARTKRAKEMPESLRGFSESDGDVPDEARRVERRPDD
ncbi:MAG: hypothetical protein S0880_19070 [Actinomycetota bacterium]|nr:hypothetical protein [Actinomycetota bacterium]